MKTKVEHPEWVLSQKRPKTEVYFLNGRYYLYSVSSKWDKETKRSKKITGFIYDTSVFNVFFITSIIISTSLRVL